MNTITDETIKVLNSLIETCCDGAKGFDEASKEVNLPELQEVMRRNRDQRRQFADELRACVVELGGEPEESGSVAGKMHRGWLKLREALSTKDNHTILAECERGEDVAVEAYEKALEDLEDLRACDVVRRQYTAVQRSHDAVRDLRDSPIYQKV